MTYHKPDVVELGSAVSVIQGVGKGTFPPLDMKRLIRLVTIGAYVADE